MKSTQLMILMLTLGVLVQASVVEKLVELPPSGSDKNGAEPPFDAVKYKEYLTNLKCPEIVTLHEGVKTPEVATGTIYEPTTRPPPLPSSPSPQPSPYPPPPIPTRDVPTTQEPNDLTTQYTTARGPTTQQGTAEQSNHNFDKYPDYDENINKNGENGYHEKLPDQTTNQSNGTDDKVTLSGENVNGTSANNPEECTAPLTSGSYIYNWYQLLLDNGGPPGWYFPKGLTSNLTKVVDPCSRPVLPVPPIEAETVFGFTHAEFEKVYRSEQARVRFSGTPLEFVDITGQLIWSPPDSQRRYFHFTYQKDDTGLYFHLNWKQKCVFVTSDLHVEVQCELSNLLCDCVNGQESCYNPFLRPPPTVPPGLVAALVGGGR